MSEINTLRSQPKYRHAIEITTPALFHRLETTVGHERGGTLPVKKCLTIRVRCRELDLDLDALAGVVLEITLPSEYPSGATCTVLALNNGEPVDGMSTAMATYLESFSGCECIELVLEWLFDNKNTCLLSANPATNATEGKVECYVLRYNHLLAGPEHKKEKAMVDAAKKAKLQGGLLW